MLLAPGWAQINGISNEKLSLPNAAVLAAGLFEFEPGYALQGDDRSVAFRFTAGFGKLEAGVSLDGALRNQAFGLKMGLLPDRLALIAGVEYDTRFHDTALGIVYSAPISGRLFADISAVAIRPRDWTFMAGLGFFVSGQLQPILELVADQNGFSNISYGFTFRHNDNVLVVVGVEQTFNQGEEHLMILAFTFSM